MSRRRWTVSGVTVICAAAVGAASAFGTGDVSIGQTINSGFPCLAQATIVQTHVASGASFTVPAGTWQLTSWSVSVGASTGHIAAAIFTQTGPHAFTVDAISPTETETANSLNTFPWSVTVHGGQMLGFWIDGTGGYCLHETGNASDTTEDRTGGFGKPSEGAAITGTISNTIDILNISANLAAPVSETDVHHVYTCYSKWEQDGGEVDDPGTAASLVAAGRWYPSAIPGNVDGGENVGAYHLACNPPSTVQPTGQYIGIGGAISSTAAEGSYAIAE